MSSHKRDAKQQIKARQRRRLQAHERLTRDRHQAQHVAEALQQALNDLGLPEDLGPACASAQKPTVSPARKLVAAL
jgi:hypothetical protein